MDFTGERFIPGAGLDGELEIEHYQRYHAVLDLITDKVVLDAASGEGYGSDLLARQARQVYGLEIDPGAARQAHDKYQRPNLTFLQGTIAGLPFRNATLDAVVSFETIEHVTADLQDAFIKELKRVLKPDGFLLISTPDKRVYSDLAHYHNEFHRKEFYRQEFHDFLSQHFTTVKFWEQAAVLSYVLTNGHEEQFRQLMPPWGGEGKYIVALCANAAPPDLQMGSVALDRENRYHRILERVMALQDEIEEKNNHIRIVLRDITTCEATILRLERTLALNEEQAKKRIAELDDELSKHQQLSAQLEKKLSLTTSRLNHIENTKAWRLIQALYRVKNRLWQR